jgi:hypothetical protein
MAFKLKWIDINDLNENPNNPRVIEDGDFDALCESIRSFPKMLELRPIVVNDQMVPLGGNMRLRACKTVGFEKIPVLMASELTEAEQRQFIITDNVSRGQWDWQVLREEWDVEELAEWGIELPELMTDIDIDKFFEPDINDSIKKFKVILDFSEDDFNEFNKLLDNHPGSKENIILNLLRK